MMYIHSSLVLTIVEKQSLVEATQIYKSQPFTTILLHRFVMLTFFYMTTFSSHSTYAQVLNVDLDRYHIALTNFDGDWNLQTHLVVEIVGG